ncbi:alanine racemase [Desulfitobacterium dichloroeliminans LMG P-21439]|uniref:Alanine racemase n=1 Tax=Desulfitobacterium dichloroeliminans (strain LMG P-21439 / DCA1) TaxID=871963 RepID=L0FDW9_DESDL|nr:alanine racemase [Desulfitobacterium dichloroeliminans]AGA70851.1 alanine racemase [Desulfitobacterium dichloroeliminans LMG P-21439]
MSNAWIDINLDAIAHNYREITQHLSQGARVMAVVKADAYGLGAVPIAQTLQKLGCEAFAVTTVEEGLILRQQGIQGIILVLGPVSSKQIEGALEADLQLTIGDFSILTQCATVAAQLGKEAQVHLKLETGMGRTGFFEKDWEDLAESLKAADSINPVGIYTHLARAALLDRTYTQQQYDTFQRGVKKMEQHGFVGLWKHICNSAAFLDYPEWHLDFIRTGTLLVGHFPSTSFAGMLKLQDPWIAKAQIVSLRQVPKGTFVGYQSIYRTKAETRLAVIPVGYADGFGVQPHFIPQGFWDFIKIIIKNFLALCGIFVGQETVAWQGHSIRVAGKIGMQLTVLDVGRLTCQVGDVVILPLRRTQANPRMLRQYWSEERLITKREIKEGYLQTYPE